MSLANTRLQLYQKDAILRQMREYKREKISLESQVTELEKRSIHHDDHLRIIDSWMMQLLDEIKILADNFDPQVVQKSTDDRLFPQSLLFANSELFQKHLSARMEHAKNTLEGLFSKIPIASPEVAQIQDQLSKVLAAEKEHITELHKVALEKEQLSDTLEKASYRYMVAEKKLDRMKSTIVAKMEKQAYQGVLATEEIVNAKTDATAPVNGAIDGGSQVEELELARKEALAVSNKLKEHLELLEEQNRKISEDLKAATLRLAGLNDEDYAKSDLFKAMKNSHDDVVKRINDLTATNTQLREEAQKLQAERQAYRVEMDNESRSAVAEVESQLAKAETDLTRIRNSRDELLAELSIKKATIDGRRVSLEHMKELISARESRITALESEVERLKIRSKELKVSDTELHIQNMSEEELRSKFVSLKKEYDLLSNEMPSMEVAWRKAQMLAAKKTTEVANWEEQIARLSAEKAKADQKYFAAMKAKESRELENRTLKTLQTKSAEMVTQLKDAESSAKSLAVNLEKQLSETRETLNSLSGQLRTIQFKFSEQVAANEGLISQQNELKNILNSRETSLQSATHAQRDAETELAEIKVRLDETKKQADTWRKKYNSNQSEEDKQLRVSDMILCKTGHITNGYIRAWLSVTFATLTSRTPA